MLLQNRQIFTFFQKKSYEWQPDDRTLLNAMTKTSLRIIKKIVIIIIESNEIIPVVIDGSHYSPCQSILRIHHYSNISNKNPDLVW